MSELKIPNHIGYIVDGNRRWAKRHGIPTYEGHLAGYNAIKDVAQATFDMGVKYMSAYIFSVENWKRSEGEVRKLMGLVLKLLTSDIGDFHKNKIRLRILGSRENLDKKILDAIEKAESETEKYTEGTLALCFNYSGQLEIADACKKIVQKNIPVDEITTETIAENIYIPDIPPVDLVVRTSGEQRLSNFMLWRSAYSELLFLDKLWPDMEMNDVKEIVKEYTDRERRFGK